MKKIVYLIGVIIAIGCAFLAGYFLAGARGGTIDQIGHEQDDYIEGTPLYSIQYLGYNNQDMAEINPDNLTFIGLDGLEYFEIQPKYHPVSIKVYQDDIELGKTLVYASDINQGFIVRGNQSDIFPNIQIELTMANGEKATINPCMSLKDGSLLVDEDGEVLPNANE